MTLDDELRRRLQQAADRAGEGAEPTALSNAVAAKVASGGAGGARLLGGLGVAGLVVGGVLGFTLLRPSPDAMGNPVVVADDVQRSSLYDCPQGAPIGSVLPGDRLFAVGRSDDGTWIAVRPIADGLVSWLPADGLRTDDDRDLVVLTCPETIAMNIDGVDATPASTTTSGASTTSSTSTTTSSTSTVPASSTTTVPTTTPATVPPTAPATTATPDTQKPTVQAGSNLSEIYDSSGPECDNEAVLTAFAADNVAVTSVTGTWTGLPGSPKAFTRGAGNTWTMGFGPFSDVVPSNQVVTITVTARDVAGNSRSTSVDVTVWGEGMCLI